MDEAIGEKLPGFVKVQAVLMALLDMVKKIMDIKDSKGLWEQE